MKKPVFHKWLHPLRQTTTGRWALRGLWVLVAIFLLADFIAQDKPLLAHYDGRLWSPVAHHYLVAAGWAAWPPDLARADWHTLDYAWAIWPIIPYSADYQDIQNPSVGPFEPQQVDHWYARHWLGTDELGRDLLAAMVHALRIDLLVGLLSMCIATIIGLLVGSLAGFWGDHQVKVSRAHFFMGLLFLWPAWFYGFQVRQWRLIDAFSQPFAVLLWQLLLSVGIATAIWCLSLLGARALLRWQWWQKRIYLPFDLALSRLIEVTVSIPALFLILLVLSLTREGSLIWVMVVIGLTRWTGIARFARAELLRIRQLDYRAAAEVSGLSRWQQWWRHALPNAMDPVYIAIAFGIANAILIEGFLSFIGLGLPPDVPTWGSLLNLGRENIQDWWLTLFPGLALFVTVVLFNTIGEQMSRNRKNILPQHKNHV